MWFLRYERRSFAPVLLCFPLAGALLGVAENLCVLGMLAEPEQPSVLLAAIGGVAGTSKIILLAETLIAIAWAVGRLPHRIRRVDLACSTSRACSRGRGGISRDGGCWRG